MFRHLRQGKKKTRKEALVLTFTTLQTVIRYGNWELFTFWVAHLIFLVTAAIKKELSIISLVSTDVYCATFRAFVCISSSISLFSLTFYDDICTKRAQGRRSVFKTAFEQLFASAHPSSHPKPSLRPELGHVSFISSHFVPTTFLCSTSPTRRHGGCTKGSGDSCSVDKWLSAASEHTPGPRELFLWIHLSLCLLWICRNSGSRARQWLGSKNSYRGWCPPSC